MSQGEQIERIKKRAEGGDAKALNVLAGYYRDGGRGLPQDYGKAMQLLLRAGELGCAMAYGVVADHYDNGLGVEKDLKKATYYYELAAMGGDAGARANLGVTEAHAGNFDRAVKHFMISVGAGDDHSLNSLRECFLHGDATKDDFEKALRAHKKATDETRSDQRDAAAAFYD